MSSLLPFSKDYESVITVEPSAEEKYSASGFGEPFAIFTYNLGLFFD